MDKTNLPEIENLINSYNLKLDNISQELKQYKGMLNSILDNDDEYQAAQEEFEKINKVKKLARQKFNARPEAAQIIEKIRDYQCQQKEMKVALSDYLTQYLAISGTNQIPSPTGGFYKIIYSAKMVKDRGI